MKSITESEALNKAAAYCTACERCKSEVHTKLLSWGMDSTQSAQIIGHLVDEGFIDEERYCRAFTNDKIKFNRWGRIKITAALRMKQLPSSSISDAISQIDETEYLNALKNLIAAKRKELRGNDYSTMQKLLRFAVGRGFEPSLIMQVIKYNPDEMDF